MSTNIIDYNQLNASVDNKPKFDSSGRLANIPVKNLQPVVTISLKGGKKFIKTLDPVLT